MLETAQWVEEDSRCVTTSVVNMSLKIPIFIVTQMHQHHHHHLEGAEEGREKEDEGKGEEGDEGKEEEEDEGKEEDEDKESE